MVVLLTKMFVSLFLKQTKQKKSRDIPGYSETKKLKMVILLTKVFVFLFCLNFVSPWPTIYDEEDFETPLVDDVPSYFKGKTI